MDQDRLRRRLQYVRLLEEFIRDEERRLPASDLVNLCQYTAWFAFQNHSGVLVSSSIETALLRIARQIEVPRGEFRPGSILHVLTQAYRQGGHTRLVENWISFQAGDMTHSVVITHHGESEIPERLAEEVQKHNGGIYRLNGQHPLNKALDLRRLAGGYEVIVLHTHPFDVAPLLAFGHEDFPRPVVISNHADHTFWLGVSICDALLDMSTRGQGISRRKRGIYDSHLLPIPVGLPPRSGTRSEARQRLGVPPDGKIVLSVGQSSKYAVCGGFNFPAMAASLVRQVPGGLFLVVGPDATIPEWQTACRDSGGRVVPVGGVPHDRLADFFQSADVYIESFPVGGGTASIEALMSGLPLISVDTEQTQFDSCSNYRVHVTDVIPRCLDYLEGRRSHDVEAAFESIRPHLSDEWSANLTRVLDRIPREHRLRSLPLITAGFDAYDERLAALSSVAPRAHEMALVQSLTPETQARYLSMMIRRNPLVHRNCPARAERRTSSPAGARPGTPG